MKRLCLVIFAFALFLNTLVGAQQAGDNVNVLPVVPPVDGDGFPVPDWYLKGDGYLQRQVEPTIAASTLNQDHLLAFFNDYRAVDQVAGDVGLGEGNVAVAALKIVSLFMPPALGSNLPRLQLVPPMNAAEAWIGGARSTNGGYSWSGFYVPGAPAEFYDDQAPPMFSQDAPIYGMEAATDPVLAAGPCGTFYVVGVAFTRGGESNIFVARYRDTNNIEDGDPFVYEGMTVIESGNNAEHGYFLDKPDIEVDPFRFAVAKGQPSAPVDECSHRVYVTYSTFNGLTKDGKVQTKMNFAVSEDGGETFTTQKIHKNFNQNQGSAIAIDPRPGTPTETGGGTIHVFWRHFFDPHAMIHTMSTTYGARWTAPVIISDPPLVPFDQPTISVEAAETLFPADRYPNTLNPGFPETAFRSNAFPTAAVAVHLPEGIDPDDAQPGDWIATPYVAWQERVGADGQPGIVMMRSQDEGVTWSGFSPLTGDDGPRQAVDKRQRDEPFDPYLVMPPGAPLPGDLNYQHTRPAGGQVQPKLSFAGGRLMLTFYESRGRIADYGSGGEYIESSPDLVSFTPYLTGYDRVMDFRGTLLNPADGTYASPAGVQISRYPIRGGADLSDGQDLLDVAAINAPCFPDDPTATEVCVRQVNHTNDPTSALGTSPFIGDYPDTVPFVQFIPEGDGWRWTIKASDVPNRGFHAIWTDNRHLLPPTQVYDEDGFKISLAEANVAVWDAYQLYGPPGIGGPCINPGSRNTDVLTSRVNTDVIVRAPTTFKQLDADRGFPFSVSNQTAQFRRFTVTIIDGDEFATLSPIENADGTWVDEDQKTIIVFPYSSAALTLFVPLPPGVEPGEVDRTEEVGTLRIQVVFDEYTDDPVIGTNSDSDPALWPDCATECFVGTLSFNAYQGNPPVGRIDNTAEEFGPSIGDAFVINWDLDNAFVINNYLDNAFVINTSDPNAFVINASDPNAFVINAFVINAFVINSSLAKAGGEGEKKIYGVTDVVWTMQPGSSNTAGSFLPLVNIDDAELYLANEEYAFQLIVDIPSSYGSAPECSEYASSVYQQQVLSNVVQNPADPNAFVINKSPENAFVINGQEPNAFVINSTFALAPAESQSKRTGALWKVGEPINDDEGRAAPPSNQVRVTLRAFQLVENPTHEYNPGEGGWVPSVAVADIGCGGAVGESPFDCFTIDGPNLIPSSNVVATPENPLTVDRCGVLEFDAGAFTVSNPNLKEGTTDAVTRAIDEFQHHGFFLVRRDSTGQEIFKIWIGEFTAPKTLLVDDSVSSPALAFDIPSSVEEGSYTLVFFADDPLKVSEYDETDNTLEFPIVVESGARFEGLQSPLLEENKLSALGANSGSAVPLKWQYVNSSGAPVDSGDANPIITFSGWTGSCDSFDPESSPNITFVTDEDPGSSGLRYDALSKSWQFNWQTKFPETWEGPASGDPGDTLPGGCYEIELISTFSCDEQSDGPFLVQLR